MSKVSHQYAAGLLDGEGTVTLTRHDSSSKWRAPVVSITSTTPEFLIAMQDTYGGHIVHHTTKQANWQQAYSWKVTNNAALALLAEVEPFMLEPKKRARAKHIRVWYKNLTPRNGKYTPHMLKLKQEFEDAFFAL